MKNFLWYLGFLGLLSVLYFVNGEIAYLGFATFFLYFTIYSENDERLKENAGKSATNAFLFLMLIGSLAIAYNNFVQNPDFLKIAFAVLFGGSIVICVLSYNIYNYLDELKN